MKEYEIFNVVFRIPNGTKYQTTNFIAYNDDIELYGIEKFYEDVQWRLENEHKILAFLKINETILIDGRTFDYIPRGKPIKIGMRERAYKELIHKWKLKMVK